MRDSINLACPIGAEIAARLENAVRALHGEHYFGGGPFTRRRILEMALKTEIDVLEHDFNGGEAFPNTNGRPAGPPQKRRNGPRKGTSPRTRNGPKEGEPSA